MSRLVMLLLGACALMIATTVERLIAPFYGLGPFLHSGLLTVGLAALATGWLLAPGKPGNVVARGPLLASALWTMLAPWLRTPLLHGLEGLGLQVATLAALVLFAGIPLALLGFALAAQERAAGDGRPASLAWALLGGALAAPLVTWVLIPALGVWRTLLVVGLLQAIAAALLPGGKRARTVAAALFPALLAGASALRFQPLHREILGRVDARDAATADYVVVDRPDGRFLLADGGIQTLISSETADPQMRPSATFQILNLYVASPESMLVLGLRGGATARRFAREGWNVRAVESDPAEIAVAERDLHFSRDEVPVTLADPRTWARRARGRYPVVLLDAFGQSALPFHLVTREFFRQLAPRLTADGILALAVPSASWNDPWIASLGATLGTAFRHVLALPTSEPPNTPGSIVLLASNRDLELPDERLPQPTDFLMNLEEHWGVVQMNHAWFNRYRPGAPGAMVMTDDRAPTDPWSDRIQRSIRGELHASFGSAGRSW